ncbi:MAG TPA: DUF6529 family protein [Pseudonocardia sp.]
MSSPQGGYVAGGDPDPPTTPLQLGQRGAAARTMEPPAGTEEFHEVPSQAPTSAIPHQATPVDMPTAAYDGRAYDTYDDGYDEPGYDEQAARAQRSSPVRVADEHARLLLVPVLIGGVVAVALGVYGRLHDASGVAVNIAGFSGTGYVKAWLATVAAGFGIAQLLSAFALYRSDAPWLPGLHRWSGRIAVLVSVPVAVHCLYALGFESGSTRVVLHSIAGCVFYGAFTTKMLCLSRAGTPRWAVPLLGGLVFTLLAALWLTSALWLFSAKGVHL